MVNPREPVATRKLTATDGPGDTEILVRIGRTVRALRALRGMTQAQLANAVGISQNHLSNIEGGKREAGIVMIARLSRAIRVPVDVLIVPALVPERTDDPREASNASFAVGLRELLLSTLEEAAKP